MASKKRTEAIVMTLRNALLADGPMARALFEYELEENVEYLVLSKQNAGADHVFAVTENMGDVAMLLIDASDAVYVNEKARSRLQELWPGGKYRSSLEPMLPDMVHELEGGNVFVSVVQLLGSAPRFQPH